MHLVFRSSSARRHGGGLQPGRASAPPPPVTPLQLGPRRLPRERGAGAAGEGLVLPPARAERGGTPRSGAAPAPRCPQTPVTSLVHGPDPDGNFHLGVRHFPRSRERRAGGPAQRRQRHGGAPASMPGRREGGGPGQAGKATEGGSEGGKERRGGAGSGAGEGGGGAAPAASLFSRGPRRRWLPTGSLAEPPPPPCQSPPPSSAPSSSRRAAGSAGGQAGGERAGKGDGAGERRKHPSAFGPGAWGDSLSPRPILGWPLLPKEHARRDAPCAGRRRRRERGFRGSGIRPRTLPGSRRPALCRCMPPPQRHRLAPLYVRVPWDKERNSHNLPRKKML